MRCRSRAQILRGRWALVLVAREPNVVSTGSSSQLLRCLVPACGVEQAPNKLW